MDKSKEIIVWIAGAAGLILLYSAYKGKSPLMTVQNSLANTSNAPSTQTGTSTPGITSPGNSSLAAGATTTGSMSTISGGYVYDSNGVMIGAVPPGYANSPGTYIPPNRRAFI